MRTRTPLLKIQPLAVDELTLADLQNFINQECSSQREAAEFFNVDLTTVQRWLMGTRQPNKTCFSLLALYRVHTSQLQEAA